MRIFNDNNFKIEYFDNPSFRWETHLLKITRKLSSIKYINVNNVRYNFYANEITVDVTDYVRVYYSGSFPITYNNANVVSITWFATNGAQSLFSEIYPPQRIPIVSVNGSFPVLIFMPDRVGQTIRRINDDGTVTVWGTVENKVQSLNVWQSTKRFTIGEIFIHNGTFDPTFDHTFEHYYGSDHRYIIDFYKPRCGVQYDNVRWQSQGNFTKYWWFARHSVIHSTSKTIDVLKTSNPDGYNTMSDKLIDIIIGQENADLLTSKYLSDIVLSDSVAYLDEVSGSWIPVNIKEKQFRVDEKQEPKTVIFTMQVKNYRTI